MEIYSLYNTATIVCSLFGTTDKNALIGGLIGGSALWLALFVLQGFGLYKMAKNRGMKRKWLAFVPFANILYIGKLTGDCQVFGQRMKRAGLYTMIAQILTTALCAITVAAELYLYIVNGTPQYDEWGSPFWLNLSGFSVTAEKAYNVVGYILPIFQLVYELLMLILLFGLYKKYYPKNYMFLGILSLFIPTARFIVVFVLRNRKAIDYEAYMQARREAYMRQQQQYYNTYGNPYGGYNRPYGNPYGQNGYNQPQRPEPEDPFTEFGGKKSGDKDAPFDEFGGKQGDEKDGKNENPFDDF